MEENRKNSYRSEEAFWQEINSDWDVEQFLAQKRGEPLPESLPAQPRQTYVPVTEAPAKPTPEELPAQRLRAQTATAQRPVQKKAKKKQKINYRGWAKLILAALLVVAIIVVLVILIGKIAGGSSEPEVETVAVDAGPTREEIISGLIGRADRFAQSYDYDGAIAILREYGADWMQQPELMDANARYQSAQSLLVKWADVSKVSMLSFHSLIADPSRAFDGDSRESYYRDYMVTVSEFKAILQELYNKNYILVSIHDLYTLNYGDPNTDQAATYAPAELYLPDGKKPLVLVQDDLNYAPSMTDGNDDGYADKDGDGFASRLVLDGNGQITCEYITADGQTLQGDYDLVPILETFIQEHPDFTYRGARGILSLTGADGVFGYHTAASWKDKLGAAYTEEVNGAKKVADALKSLGWEFASHTYEHISYGDSGAEALKKDLQLWKDEVQSIIGETDLLMYPARGGLYAYDDDLFNAIYANGFRVFCNVDTETTELRFFDTYLRINRTPVGGQWFDSLDEFFSGSKVKDSARR